MAVRARYVSAVLVNVALPWMAYRVAFMYGGVTWAHAASIVPLLAWLTWDFARHRHFDALTALVLVGMALSFVTVLITRETWKRLAEEPLVSGMIGVVFLLSLLTRRPLVYYLARSTMARERIGGAAEFEELWRTRADLPGHIRLLTMVWGGGLAVENLLRGYVVWSGGGVSASRVVEYAFYGSLTGWTLWYRRRRIKRD